MRADVSFLGSFPRYVLESFGLIILAITFLYLILNNVEKSIIISTLGVFALASQKLLPAFQKMFFGWFTVKRFSTPLTNIFDITLNNELKDQLAKPYLKKYVLKDSIELKNVSFKFNKEDTFILKDVNLKIYKGENIGIIGQTGSGKSTLIDIISGFLIPTKGKVFIDGIDIYKNENSDFLDSWRYSIGYVPQNIFLLDKSIEKNITLSFSDEQINKFDLNQAINIADLKSYINSQQNGYETLIGERGINLSGGQKQRLAIARAMYFKPEILVLDEATSALDNQTESKIIKSIYKQSKGLQL